MKKSFNLFKLIFAIMFTVPLVVWCFLLASHIKCVNIINNGTEIEATVESYYSSVEINEVPYYNLVYSYEVDGIKHSGETSANFTYHQAISMEKILIKYDKDFNSIEASYNTGVKTELIVLPLVSLIGIGFFVWFAISIVKDLKESKAKKLGIEKRATFVNSISGVIVNNVPYYRLIYSYTDENGQEKEVKTGSKYTFEEIEFFKSLKKFSIKEYKGITTIIEKIDLSKTITNEKNSELSNELKVCAYCESIVSITDKKCPNCGSGKFTEYNK